ncbi:scopoletin glucosyltransferase-like [Senna tora]|uniref:Scopoletin glucosyltransferase-like n=1 Tax=Senna tora TaxID=362788 RepID=A0A834SVW4_9FABA|nr:scopoletin glucosyltransferase-like [Senna tora]
MAVSFYKTFSLLQQPLEQLLQEHQPHCLIADTIFPWATELAAAKFRSIEDKTQRGNPAINKEHECLKWLNSKEPDFWAELYLGIVKKQEKTNEDHQWLPEGLRKDER